jgi:hypothetical protein
MGRATSAFAARSTQMKLEGARAEEEAGCFGARGACEAWLGAPSTSDAAPPSSCGRSYATKLKVPRR